MLIDFHTHCFPEKVAPKAIAKLSEAAGGITNYSDGTVAGLRKRMAESGTDVSVVLNIATNAHQQRSVNDYAGEINNGRDIFSFGSVFPDGDDVFDELERIKAMGLKGVKLHPDYQGFFIDDEKMKPIYQKISSLGLIMIFHAGADYGFPPPYHATPDRIARAMKWFDGPVIAAHWGGLNYNEEVLQRLCGSEIYFDCALGYMMMPKFCAEKIIEKHGCDKILFGTDSPWHTAEMELKLLNSLGLSSDELEKITSGNAKKLLGI